MFVVVVAAGVIVDATAVVIVVIVVVAAAILLSDRVYFVGFPPRPCSRRSLHRHQELSRVLGTSADDDNFQPKELHAEFLVWDPTPPSPDVFNVPAYCSCPPV